MVVPFMEEQLVLLVFSKYCKLTFWQGTISNRGALMVKLGVFSSDSSRFLVLLGGGAFPPETWCGWKRPLSLHRLCGLACQWYEDCPSLGYPDDRWYIAMVTQMTGDTEPWLPSTQVTGKGVGASQAQAWPIFFKKMRSQRSKTLEEVWHSHSGRSQFKVGFGFYTLRRRGNIPVSHPPPC